MVSFPKISIVTPSYNQGRFIEETIISVLGQGYPNLEYIIIDGGSTDNTVDIIKKYSDRITYWVSEKDRGQSHAINKGFELATGDILGWLNSDDVYTHSSLFHVAATVNLQVKGVYFGNCIHFKQGSTGVISWGSDVVLNAQASVLENYDYIIQPSSFWTKETWDYVDKLNEGLHFSFDWEWFLRAKQKGVAFHAMAKCLSMYRIHDEHKTGTGGTKRQEEILSVYKLYSERFATLYDLLAKEKTYNLKLKKIIKTTLRIYGRPNGDANVLKVLNHNKFKEYAWSEVVNCLSML